MASCRPEEISGLWFRVIPASLVVRAVAALGEGFVHALADAEIIYFRGDFYLSGSSGHRLFGRLSHGKSG